MLTDTKLKNLKPSAKLYKVTDRDGLYVAVLKTGVVSFRYDYRINRRRETLTIGKYGRSGINLAEARELLYEAKKQISAGVSPAKTKKDARKISKKSKTFCHYALDYFAAVRLAESTKSMKLSVLDRDVIPSIGRYLMPEITSSVLRSLCERVKNRGARATALQVREIVSAVFQYANDHGERFGNPAEEIKASSIATFQPRDRSLNPKEIAVFFRYLDKVGALPTMKLALRLALLTLVRKSELIKATWDEVDFEGACWVIPAGRMKAGRAHVIYLSEQALDIMMGLKMCAGGSDFILPSRYDTTKCLSNSALNRLIDSAVELANKEGERLEHFSVHDLRRTASTLLHEAGFNSDWIEKCLAHEQKGVRAVYNKAEYAAQRRNMLQQWANMVDDWCRQF